MLLAGVYTVLKYTGYGLLALVVILGGIAILGAKAFGLAPHWGDVEDRRRAKLHDAIEHAAGGSTGSAEGPAGPSSHSHSGGLARIANETPAEPHL